MGELRDVEARGRIRSCGKLLAVAVAVAVAALLLGGPAAVAQAHPDSGAVYSGRAGPYQIYAFDGSAAARPGTVRYRLVVWEVASGQPVDEAIVTVLARPVPPGHDEHRLGPVRARAVANVYRYTLPDPGAARWRARVTVDAAYGTATTRPFLLHGLRAAVTSAGTRSSGHDGALVGAIVLGLAAAALVVIVALTRHRSSRPGNERSGS